MRRRYSVCFQHHALLVAVSLTIALGVLLARLFKVESSLGVLMGGATAICGASAALAISSVLPKSAHLERNTTLTVVAVTTLSTLAMVARSVCTFARTSEVWSPTWIRIDVVVPLVKG